MNQELTNIFLLGSGCGSVGKAVVSDTRGPRFESSHRRTFYWTLLIQLCRKDENKEKEAGNAPFFSKKNIFLLQIINNT